MALKRHLRQCSDSVLYCNKALIVYNRSISYEKPVEGIQLKRHNFAYWNKTSDLQFHIVAEKTNVFTNVIRVAVARTAKLLLFARKLRSTDVSIRFLSLIVLFFLISDGMVIKKKENVKYLHFSTTHNVYKDSLLHELLKLHNFPLSCNSIYPSISTKHLSGMSNGSCSNISESMSNEMMRLYTLRNFPRDINISLIRIARAGFYYTNCENETKCFSCGITYHGWISGDDPMIIHRRISPSCDIVLRSNSSNGSINEEHDHSSNNKNVTVAEITNIDKTNFSIQTLPNDNVIANRSEESGSESRMSADSRNNIFTKVMKSQDIKHDKSSEDKQDECEQTLGHHSNNTHLESDKDSSTSINDSSEIPRYPNYASIQVRISSYSGWPSYLNQTPREMARAGFLFAGYNDYTRCFHCGGGLRNWESGDDPWVEHARWFPKCTFLKKNKGEIFISAVLKKIELEKQKSRFEQNEQTLYSRTAATSSSPCRNAATTSSTCRGATKTSTPCRDATKTSTPCRDATKTSTPCRDATKTSTPCSDISEENCLLGSLAARSVLEMGFSNEQVLDAIRAVHRTIGEGNGVQISVTDIMDVLLHEEQNTLGAVGISRQTNHLTMPANNTTTTSANTNETESLVEENRQLKEQRLCKVCMDLDATVAFLPCGHIVCCTDCAPAMRKCPVCRAHVKGTVKTFLA